MVATFSGEIDALARRVSLTSAPAAATQLVQAEIPVVQDGTPGSGPPDTVELVTERYDVVSAGCGAVDGFEGDIRLRSFFAGQELRDTYVVIDWIDATGRDACNSAPPARGLSDQYGLFPYGTLAGSGANAVATWRFRLPTRTAFRFGGRVIADVVDTVAPVTAATPPGGTFGAARTVTLACMDARSGCAATYYTVDGSTPTTASPVYEGAPILVARSTTIRFFSVDAAGNAEAPRAEAYVIDTVPPSVAAVAPWDGQGDVPASAVVRVTFSEPVDPATVPGAIAVTGPGGPVAGTIAPESGTTWTFTPSAPLEVATRYAVAVSTAVRDPVGRPLTAASSSGFVTVTPPVVVSGAGSANLVNRGVVEDAGGNRLALFSANTYHGAKLLWSYRPAATGAWTAPQALHSARSIAPPEAPVTAKVAASGARFMAAWRNPRDAALETSLFDGAVPGPVEKHWRLRYENAPVLDVVGNGTGGFAVVGSDADTDRVYGAVYRGTGWSWDWLTVDAGTARASAPVVASRGGDAWVAAYRAAGTAIFTSRYVLNQSTMQGRWTATLLQDATGTSTMLPPAIAASSTRVCVAWGIANGWISASVDPGTGFFGRGQTLGTSGTSTLALSAASSGDRFAVTWDKYGSTYEYDAPYARWYWSGQSDLTSRSTSDLASGAVVAPAANGFVAGLRTYETFSDSPTHVTVNKDVAGSFFTTSRELQAESFAEDVRDLTVSGHALAPALLAWVRDDGAAARVETKTYDGSSLGAEELVSSTGVPGSVGGPVRLARNAAGDVLAVWHQDDGSASGVFAALRRGGTWAPAVRLARHARDPVVASDGAGFLVVYRDLPSYAVSNLIAIEWSAGAWGAPFLLEANSDSAAVASDGRTYAVVWLYGGSRLDAALKTAAGWGPVRTPDPNGTPARRPSITAARASEYVAAYAVDYGAQSHVVRSTVGYVSGGQVFWDLAQTVYAAGTSAITAGPVVTASAGRPAIVWADGGAARAVLGNAWGWGSGASWPAPTVIVPAASCGIARAAASATGWLAALDCGGVRLVRYAGGGWGAPEQPGLTASDLAVASDGSRYKVLARVADGGSTSLVQLDVASGTTHGPATLASGAAPSAAPVDVGVSVLHDGTDWVAAWPQQGADPVVDVVMARTAF